LTVPGSWDFKTTQWSLLTSDYVSAPSCLATQIGGINYWRALYRGTLCIPEGRMVGYWKTSNLGTGRPGFCFWSQAPVGATTPVTEWRVDLHINGARMTRWYGGFSGVLYEFPLKWHPTSNVWYKVRVTWWYSCTSKNVRQGCTSFDYWDGTAWVSLGTLKDIPGVENGSLINRCGVCADQSPGSPAALCQQDDTEIWVPAV